MQLWAYASDSAHETAWCTSKEAEAPLARFLKFKNFRPGLLLIFSEKLLFEVATFFFTKSYNLVFVAFPNLETYFNVIFATSWGSNLMFLLLLWFCLVLFSAGLSESCLLGFVFPEEARSTSINSKRLMKHRRRGHSMGVPGGTERARREIIIGEMMADGPARPHRAQQT